MSTAETAESGDASHFQAWLVPLPTDDAASAEVARQAQLLLDGEERARLAGLRTPAARRRFAGAHLGLRLILAHRLQVPPGQLVFDREPCPLCGDGHGRPVLRGHNGIHFSMSYRDGVAAYAIASRPVGIDIEAIDREISLEDLSAALHPNERAELAASSPPARRRAALTCWVRKEAYLKGVGTGLGLDPASVYTGTGAAGQAPQITSARPRPLPPTASGSWSVTDLDAGPRHLAAAAVLTDDGRIPPRGRAALNGLLPSAIHDSSPGAALAR